MKEALDYEFDEPPEILSEYFEDHYDQSQEDFPDYENPEEAFYGRVMNGAGENGLSPFSFSEIMEHCLEPTLKDGLAHIGKLIFWCVIFRILTQSVVLPKRISVHFVSFVVGLFASTHFFYTNSVYLLTLSLISYLVLRVTHRWLGSHRGAILAVTSLGFNLSSEYYVAQPVEWHSVRGAQMILSMKIISLGFDIDSYVEKNAQEETYKPEEETYKQKESSLQSGNSRRRKMQNRSNPEPVTKEPTQSTQTSSSQDFSDAVPIFHFLGYTFCPGNCVFGPWTKYSDYVEIYVNPKWNLAWMLKVIFSLIFGFLFLSISTCWNPWLIPDENYKWMIAYRDAMSFRASHYFVSFVSDSTSVAAGFGWNRETAHWTFQVAEPHNIEIPRSLVEVVVSWNRPLHQWLKNYCFKKALHYGTFFAILTTYFASTALHGLNFQLGAVLFSLGFYTYTEHRLRKRLSQIFNAAVGSRRIENSSGFVHKEGDFLSLVINFIFGLLAMFHLAYLGVMFDQQETQAEGYSWRHTIQKWESLGFASHWIISIEFLIMCLI